MLRKLKIKFVFVIMTIVTIFMILIIGAILFFTKNSIERESVQMMRTMTFAPSVPRQIDLPKDALGRMSMPFFSVEKKTNGTIAVQGNAFYDLSDEETITHLLDAVSESNKSFGILREYGLRYLITSHGNSQRIVFADISTEQLLIRGLVKNLLIIGLIAYAVFFVISLKLADWMTKPVERAWDSQKQFIADASHELKTPLTVIMTNAEMLTDESYAFKDRNVFARNILSTSKRMKGLVESLLELARIDNKQYITKREAIDFSKLINNCLLPFEPLFFENKLPLSADIEDGIQVTGDQDKLRQVVTILLDNSLKYSDHDDAVRITLKAQPHSCLLSVSGKGTPLSKADCQNIFKRFYRVDQARNDGHSYGLGLSIAESIIRDHHGRIWAESKNSHNTFYVSLGTK